MEEINNRGNSLSLSLSLSFLSVLDGWNVAQTVLKRLPGYGLRDFSTTQCVKRSTEDEEGWHSRVFAIDRQPLLWRSRSNRRRERFLPTNTGNMGGGGDTVSDDGSALSVLEIAFGDCAAQVLCRLTVERLIDCEWREVMALSTCCMSCSSERGLWLRCNGGVR